MRARHRSHVSHSMPKVPRKATLRSVRASTSCRRPCETATRTIVPAGRTRLCARVRGSSPPAASTTTCAPNPSPMVSRTASESSMLESTVTVTPWDFANSSRAASPTFCLSRSVLRRLRSAGKSAVPMVNPTPAAARTTWCWLHRQCQWHQNRYLCTRRKSLQMVSGWQLRVSVIQFLS